MDNAIQLPAKAKTRAEKLHEQASSARERFQTYLQATADVLDVPEGYQYDASAGAFVAPTPEGNGEDVE